MIKRLLFMLCAAAILLLAACGEIAVDTFDDALDDTLDKPTEIIEYSLDDLLDFALVRREGIIKPNREALLPLTQGRTPGDLPSALRNNNQHQIVSLDEAIADVHIFFEALYNSYAGYVYFGGNEVFLPVKDAIIVDLIALGYTVHHFRFETILNNHLSPIINDRHFYLGSTHTTTFGRTMNYFNTPILAYDRTANGFVNRATGEYLYSIDAIDGRRYDIDEILRLHVNANGELLYRPVILSEINTGSFEVVFTYENGDVSIRRFARWTSNWRQIQYPSLRFIYDIPVVTVMTMGFIGRDNARHATDFLGFAQELIHEPAIIIDVRGNIGGNGELGVEWFNKFLGTNVPTNFVGLNTFGRNFENNHGISQNLTDRIVPSEQLFIILTDRHTSSAGEWFVDLTFNMTNTLVIGHATAGILAFSGTFEDLRLPNSGIAFGFGEVMYIWPEGHFTENAGIQPDIWVQGDALTAALALLRNLR